MKMNIEDKIVQNIAEIVKEKYGIEADENLAMVEIPKDNTKGDYSTNIAMRLTKLLKRAPKEIAEEFRSELLNRLDEVQDIEIAGPGFINFWLKKDAMAGVINTVIDAKDEYGHSNAGNGLKVLEEYVSANPTGPLHCGHARGACWGDSCVRIMKAAGYDALREYYINDAGAQILNLANLSSPVTENSTVWISPCRKTVITDLMSSRSLKRSMRCTVTNTSKCRKRKL